jgi:hypothetical protein
MSLKEKTQTLFAENLATLPAMLFRRQAAST